MESSFGNAKDSSRPLFGAATYSVQYWGRVPRLERDRDILRLEIVRLFSSSATIMVSGSARDMSLGNSDRGLTMRLDAYVFFVKILCGDCRRSVTGEGYITQIGLLGHEEPARW